MLIKKSHFMSMDVGTSGILDRVAILPVQHAKTAGVEYLHLLYISFRRGRWGSLSAAAGQLLEKAGCLILQFLNRSLGELALGGDLKRTTRKTLSASASSKLD
jgi:hypothetical protein